MKTEDEITNLFQNCVSSLQKQNKTNFIVAGFNALLTSQLQSVCSSYGTITTLINDKLKFVFSVSKLKTYNSPLTNTNCFDYGLTLTVPVTVKLKLEFSILNQPDTNVVLSKVRTTGFNLIIPTGCILKLYEPQLDDKQDIENQFFPSGAFICNGKLRSLPPVKAMRNSEILLIDKTKGKGFVMCQIRSANWNKPFRTTSSLNLMIDTTNKKSLTEGVVSCSLPHAKNTIHVGALAHALGCNPSSFVNLVKRAIGDLYDPIIFRPYEISFLHDKTINNIKTQEMAMMHISKLFGKNLLSTGVNQVKTEVYSHINIELEESKNFEQLHKLKLLFLAKCVGLVILLAAGKIDDTPRDWFRFSNIVTPAHYIGILVRRCFMDHMKSRQKFLRRTLMKMIIKNPNNVDHKHIDLVKIFGEPKLSSRILSSFASGVWPPQTKGVTMALNLNNFDGIMGQLSRVQSSLSTTDSVNTEPRQVQFDGFGQVCSAFSPDGEVVGLVMELAIYTTITTDLEQPQLLVQLIELLLGKYLINVNTVLGESLNKNLQMSLDESRFHDTVTYDEWLPSYYCFFNNCGVITHFIEEKIVDEFIKSFLHIRRKGLIPAFTFLELYTKRKEIHISNCSGQFARPLIVLENLHLAEPWMDFQTMLHKGIVEYVNPGEEATICTPCISILNLNNKCTHLELAQISFLSPTVASVPFVSSQHGPRASHYAQQVKQRITAERKKQRGYMCHHELAYAFKSLVCTDVSLNFINATFGRDTPCCVVILSSKSNQEDAMEQSQASIDRGLHLSFSTRYYTSDAATVNNSLSKETFEKPKITLSRKNINYDTLQANGLPLPRTMIPGGGIVIGKTKQNKKQNQQKNKLIITTRDISTNTRKDETGSVTHVSKYKTPTGDRVNVGITTTRRSLLGDKFTTRNSGKGVTGEIVSCEDAYFSMETGMVFDLCFASLSISARQVLASLFECLAGKVTCLKAKYHLGVIKQHLNGTSNKLTEKQLSELLIECGFSGDNCETIIDPKTGNILEGRAFCGVMDIARLVHIAAKALYTRDLENGPRDPLTRQPSNGRMNDGGCRVGEFESAAISAHGSAHCLQACFNSRSDPHVVYICSECKLIVEGNEDINYIWCRSCQSRTSVCKVNMPQTCLVTLTELLSMGCNVKIAIEKEDIQKYEGTNDSETQWIKWYEHVDNKMSLLSL